MVWLIVNGQLLIVNCQLPATNHRPPATDNRNWQLFSSRATIRRLRMIALFPGFIPGLLLLGAALVALMARYRPRFTQETAVALFTLALLLWLALRPALPLLPDLAGRPLTAFAWGVTVESWTLAGAWLLLLLASSLLARFTQAAVSPGETSLRLLLGGATLAAAWAGTPALLLLTWLLLALVWGTAVFFSSQNVSPIQVARRAGWLVLAAFLLWYGAALAGSPYLATWLPAARTPLLLGIVLQLGALPIAAWRALPDQVNGRTAVLLHLAPVVPGAALLAHLGATGPIPFPLLFTLPGLLAVLAGVVRLWSRPAAPEAALAWAGSGALLLAGMWAGPSAAAAEGRVLLLAVPLLAWLPPLVWRGAPPSQLLRLGGWAIALAALIGLPLTVGWNGRAALYDAWLSGGLGLLLPVLALLHGLLLTAVVSQSRLFSPAEPPPGLQLGVTAIFVLPVAGLLALPGRPLGDFHPLVWLALLLPGLAGLLLPRLFGQALDHAVALRRILEFSLPPWLAPARLHQGARLTLTALRDAVLLLESERGLLWLLLLLLLLFVVR